MSDRSRVRTRVGGVTFPNFKAALRANKLLEKTKSTQRTEMRKRLKAGETVRFGGLVFTPDRD
jgi:hypothetical protein